MTADLTEHARAIIKGAWTKGRAIPSPEDAARACLLVEHSTPPSEAGIEAAAKALWIAEGGTSEGYDAVCAKDLTVKRNFCHYARAVILTHQAHRKGEISNG